MPPSLVFSLVMAIIIGLLFHSAFGHRLWQVFLFVFGSILGVLTGTTLATIAGWDAGMLGNTSLPAGVIGALIVLGVCWFFTSPLPENQTGVRRGVRDMVQGRDESPV